MHAPGPTLTAPPEPPLETSTFPPALAALLDTPAPGERIGRFLVEDVLGQGGFGVVLTARDTELGRRVAIKLLRIGTGESHDTRSVSGAFRREAEAAARLNHPNIVTLHDFGTWRRRPYLVLERLEGETLLARLRRVGPLPVDVALGIFLPVARALAYAHKRGVVHRDLKPGNVFLTEDGGVKVLDLGLAQVSEAVEELRTPAQRSDPAFTLSGAGTPGYMAPEQWLRERQDARTDVFASGVMLFEVLSGRLPFLRNGKADRESTLDAQPAPGLDSLVPGLPKIVASFIAKALHKDPARRFADGAELVDGLLEIARVVPFPGAVTPSRMGLRRRIALLAGLGLLVGGAVVASRLLAEPPPSPAGPFERARQRQLTFEGNARLPTVSGDGRYVAYATSDRIRIVSTTGEASPADLVAAPDVEAIRWSRDGRRLAYVSRDGHEPATFLYDFEKRERRRLRGPTLPFALSDDGRRIAHVRQLDRKLVVEALDTDVKLERPLAFPKETIVADLEFLGEGREILATTATEQRHEVWRIRLDGQTGAERVLEERARIRSVRMGGDGQRAFMLRDRGTGSELVAFTLAEPGRRVGLPALSGAVTHQGLAVSLWPERLFYVRSPVRENVWRIPLDARGRADFERREARATGTTRLVGSVASPDGRALAYAQFEASATTLVVRALDGVGPARRLARFEGRAQSPAWSPDGQRIALVCERGGAARVCVVNVESGSVRAHDAAEVSKEDPSVVWAPSPLPIFQAPGHRQQRVLNLETGTVSELPLPPARGYVFSPAPSPEGRRIALYWNRPDGRGVWIVDRATAGATLLRAEVLDPIGWSPDGRSLFAVREHAGHVVAVVRMAVPGGALEEVVTFPVRAQIKSAALGHDARYLLATGSESWSDLWALDPSGDGAPAP